VYLPQRRAFCEFYTGEGADERLHDASGQGYVVLPPVIPAPLCRAGHGPLQAMPLNHIAESDASGIVSFSGFRFALSRPALAGGRCYRAA
jgi:hypothetical protein